MRWTFGDFELDTERCLLTRDGEEVHAEPRVIETLAYLVRHRDRVVSKDELVEEVWPGAHVTDSTLKRAIQEARRALGDNGDRQDLIETVYGRGYRFVAAVAEEGSAEPPLWADPSAVGRRRVRLAAAAMTAAVLGALLFLLIMLAPSSAVFRVASGDEPFRLLVFPFDYLGPPQERWFAVALTEELTTRLAAAPELAVLSRTTADHYATDDRPLSVIGREAGLDYALEGTVLLEEGEAGSPARVRVTARLIRVEDDDHVWAAVFESELDDVFTVQAEIARRIADRLDLTLTDGTRPTTAQ